MSGIVTSTLVARKFIEQANGGDPLLTPLKLMKLVYIAQGWHLAVHGKALIDEDVQAWENGPVFPELYIAIEKYGTDRVKKVPLSFYEILLIEEGKLGEVNEESSEIIEAVSEEYWDKSGQQLSGLTHMPGTPWHDTCEKHDGYRTGPVILRSLIQEYYSSMQGR